MLKLEFKGSVYPFICESTEDYERFITLIPEPTGDYFLASIDSDGSYNIIESVAKDDVKILTA
tara:strand:- start:72 stop:260 length:189 start_codon:yes stop_codon:yes gene_type:complete